MQCAGVVVVDARGFSKFLGDLHLGIAQNYARLTLALGERCPATVVVIRPAHVPLFGLAPGQAAAIAWQPRHARVLPPAA